MSDIKDMFENYFEAYKQTSEYKDRNRLEIAFRKNDFEKNLNDMWNIYKRNPAQIVEYNKQIDMIKETGCKVMRNSQGIHKIIVGAK